MLSRFETLQHSLKYKLLLLTVLPLLLTALGFAVMAGYWTTSYTDRQLYMKVSADLSVAQGTLNILQREQLDSLIQLANGYEFRTNLLKAYRQGVQNQLQEVRQSRKLDFLRFITAAQLEASEEATLHRQRDTLKRGEAITGLSVLPADELESIQSGLSQQAKILLIDTPYAEQTDRSIEDRAMLLRTLYPVLNDFNQLIGILDAGVIFNRNTNVVDMIRDLVYGQGSLPEGGIGTVTLFLDDVRISTNVPQSTPEAILGKTLSVNDRAIGTRVSQAVKDHVLRQGNKWLNRAFVVNDWYISAYQPLLDIDNQKIGMIYTGFNEAPFNRIYFKTLIESSVMIGFIMLFSGALVFQRGRLLLQPLTQLHDAVQAVRQGNMEQRIGSLETSDELADLAIEFDKMLDLLEERDYQIRKANDELEATVEQRTRSLKRRTEALKQHIKLLKNTRRQLLDKEKLAVLGELTAGIAHEINNPAAVILGSIDLLTDELGAAAEPAQAEIDMIIQQVYRIRSLINNLLQYSRPGTYVDSHAVQNINTVCDDTLLLVRHALDKQRVSVDLDYQATTLVEFNTQQIQQVLVNLILNAAHATQGPGKILVSTQDWTEENETKGVCISVTDFGHGISNHHLGQVFDPFFTTKESGTGLGLSVSHGIIQRHSGKFNVQSKEGQGSCFTICLPEHYTPTNSQDNSVSELLDGLAQAERTNRRAIRGA